MSRNNLNISRQFVLPCCQQDPAGPATWKCPLVICLSDVLALPNRVPLKALKGFEGYMVRESVSCLKKLYLPADQRLMREKVFDILAFLKSAGRPPSNTAISNLCSINIGSLLLIWSLYFFFFFMIGPFLSIPTRTARASNLRVNGVLWKLGVKMMSITWEEAWRNAKHKITGKSPCGNSFQLYQIMG